MAKSVLYMSMSLDGFVGSDREHPGMAIPEGAELKQWKLDRISKAGAHLMGRTSYQEMSSYWPQSDDEYAAPMNNIPKVVFSKTLGDAEATWPVTRVARGGLAAERNTKGCQPMSRFRYKSTPLAAIAALAAVSACAHAAPAACCCQRSEPRPSACCDQTP